MLQPPRTCLKQQNASDLLVKATRADFSIHKFALTNLLLHIIIGKSDYSVDNRVEADYERPVGNRAERLKRATIIVDAAIAIIACLRVS